MKKVIRKVTKEERKGNLNEPLVVIEQDSVLTEKRVISDSFNKATKNSSFAIVKNLISPDQDHIIKHIKEIFHQM